MRHLILPCLAALLALTSDPASAHLGSHDPQSLMLAWTFEPWLVLSLAAALGAYIVGLKRMRPIARRQLGIAPPIAFAVGILVLLIALESPLDAISEDLFSAHMVQHLLLMLVVAPVFVAARPLLVFVWAIPPDARKSVGRLWAGGRMGRVVAWLTTPVSAWIVFAAMFAFWHLPGPYGWALQNELVHVAEHLCFFLSAFAFWAVVMEPATHARLDYGGRVLFVATAAVLSSLPGALMVLTSRAFYSVHAAGAARWGLTPLEDQNLAGLIMWIPAGFAYLAAIMVLSLRWLQTAERRAAARPYRWATGSLSLLLLVLTAGCNDRSEPGAATIAQSIGGDAQKGIDRIARAGCGSCHTIPGITGAEGLVGPPLDHMSRRIYIAGMLRNTPDNMVIWLRNPQAIVPGNAMPNMGLDEQQARDIAAFLYSLQ